MEEDFNEFEEFAINELDELFDNDLDDEFAESEDFTKISRFCKPKKVKHFKQAKIHFKNAHKLIEQIDLSKGDDVFCFVSGAFIFSDFIHGLFTHHNIFAKKLIISTLSFDKYNIGQLRALVEKGYIGELTIIVSDYFFAHERKKAILYAYEQLAEFEGFQLVVARVHTKMTIFETDKGNKFVIHGSANLRSSDNVEQLHLTQNSGIYDFSKNFFEKLESEYFTLKKSIKTNQIIKTFE